MSCEILEWDSNFFGLTIGRVDPEFLESNSVAEIDKWSNKNGVKCIYFLSEASEFSIHQIVQSNGFKPVGVRLTLKVESQDLCSYINNLVESDGCCKYKLVRPAMIGDLERLSQIAGKVHSNTRFWSDPNFSSNMASQLYSEWITNDFRNKNGHDKEVFVAELDGETVGYISVTICNNIGNIALLGVDPSAQKKGLGTMLLRRALKWTQDHGVEASLVATQANNMEALRLYMTHGFKPIRSQIWFHKWYRNVA